MNLTVIGIGKLGLCTALCFERAGYNIMGVDINQDYVEQINNKTLISHEPLVNEYIKESTNFRATTSLEEGLLFADIYFIVIHTPNGGGEQFYDHCHLNNLLIQMNNHKLINKHIVICCTIMPQYIQKYGTRMEPAR